jgi:hypothetical protein
MGWMDCALQSVDMIWIEYILPAVHKDGFGKWQSGFPKSEESIL